MGRTYNLMVRASGNTSDAQRALRQLSRRVEQTGARISSVGRTMSMAITAPLVGLGVMGARELGAMEKASKQTEISLRRFGGEAKISSKLVGSLASALQEKSGIDDQSIQSGQNLLLTMGAVNVKTVEGVKLFKRASLSMTEFADTMGRDVSTAGRLYAKTLAEATKGNIALPKNVKLSAIEMKNLEASMKNASTATEKQQLVLDALSKKFRGGMDLTSADKLNVAMDKLAGIGAKLVVMLLPALDMVVAGIGRLAKVFDALTPVQQRVVGLVTLLAAAFGPVLIAVGSLIQLFSGPLAAALAGMAGGPIVGIVAAIAGLGIAFTIAYRKSESFRVGVQNVLRNVRTTFVSIFSSLRQTLSTWFSWGQSAWNRWGDNLLSVVKPVFSIMRAYIGSILNNIASLIKIGLAVIRGDWGTAWNELKKMVSNTWNAIKTIVKNGFEAVKAVLGNLKDAVLSIGSKLYDAGKKIGKKIIDGIKAGVREYADDIAGAVTTAINPASLTAAVQNKIMNSVGVGKGKSGPLNKRGGSANKPSGGVNVFGELFGNNPSLGSILNYFKLSGSQVYNVSSGANGAQTVTTNTAAKEFVQSRIMQSKKRLAVYVAQRKKTITLVQKLNSQILKLYKSKGRAKGSAKNSITTKINVLTQKRDELLGFIEGLNNEILSLGGQIQQDEEALIPPEIVTGGETGATGSSSTAVDNVSSDIIAQQTAQTSALQANLAASNQAFALFNGSGDIGSNSFNALAAARGQVQIVFNSTVPYSQQQAQLVSQMVSQGLQSSSAYANLSSGTLNLGV